VKCLFVHVDGYEFAARLREIQSDGNMGDEVATLPRYVDQVVSQTAKGYRVMRGRCNIRFYLDENTRNELMPVYRERLDGSTEAST